MSSGRAIASSLRRTGHQRWVSAATPLPTAAPTTTSDVQCTPTCTREYATAAASGATTRPSRGASMLTAVANAAAEAECPDGNDDEVGGLAMVWYAGSSEAAGRRRGSSGLSTALASALAPAMASTPRAAALRVAPRRAASTDATVNQSRLWLAAADRSFIVRSSELGGSAETALLMARSRSFTPSPDRRIHEITGRPYGQDGWRVGRTHGSQV